MSAISIWNEALKVLEKNLTDVSFNTYIVPLKPIYIKDDTLYLLTEENFYKITIDQRYLQDIIKSLKIVTNNIIEYANIITMEDLENQGEGNKKDAIMNDNFKFSNLIEKYRFDNFVKGKSNELAYTLSMAVADSPGKAYNPLFLYGGVGLGKTHLMHSIGNHLLEKYQDKKVLYCTSETFTNELIGAIGQNKNQEFRNKYRQLDILLIDDIQFLSNKEGTQEEFFHTFNDLYNANKQIVITSDLPPKELKTLEDRLRSRFNWGIIADITLPDFETRTAIVERKAEMDNVKIPTDVTKFIARNVVSNIRDLEGALNKVAAYSTLSKSPISLDLAEIALKDMIVGNEKPEVTVEYIQEVVADFYDITRDDIIGKKRTQAIAFPRQIAMYLSRKLIDITLPKIGELFGGRDHSTIIHGCDKIMNLIETDEEVKEEVFIIEKRIVD